MNRPRLESLAGTLKASGYNLGVRRSRLAWIDRPWRRDKIAYLIRRGVDQDSVARAEEYAGRELARLPLKGLRVDRVSTERALRDDVRLLMSTEDEMFGARFIIAPDAFAIICNHAVGDTSFMFPTARILAGALDAQVSSSRIAVVDAVQTLARLILRHPSRSTQTLLEIVNDLRQSVARVEVGSTAAAGGWAHEYITIAPEVIEGWRVGRMDGESENACVIRKILESLHSKAIFPLSVRLSIMVDLRRYNGRLRPKVGNFVGAVHMPLAVAVSGDSSFGRHLRKQLKSARPLVGCVYATLREGVSAALFRSSHKAAATVNPEIHVSFTADPALGREDDGLEVFVRPRANVLAVRVAINANGGASASFNSAYRPDDLRSWVCSLEQGFA